MRWPSIAGSVALLIAGTGVSIGAARTSVPIPSSCNALRPDVSKYLARVASVKSETPSVARVLACDFFFVDGSPGTVVHVLAGSSPKQLLATRAVDQSYGYTTEAVPQLGKDAFSMARDHKPMGLMALSSSNVLYGIIGHFSFTKDMALIKALFKLK